MRPFASGDLDGMTHLDHVDPVGIERLCGEGVEAARRRGRCSMCHPADRPAGEKRYDHRSRGNRTPGAGAAGQFVEIQARRDWLRGEHAEARADRVRLRAPLRDAGSIFRMRGKPRLDSVAAVGRKLAIDIGVQLFLRHGWVSVDHCLRPRFI